LQSKHGPVSDVVCILGYNNNYYVHNIILFMYDFINLLLSNEYIYIDAEVVKDENGYNTLKFGKISCENIKYNSKDIELVKLSAWLRHYDNLEEYEKHTDDPWTLDSQNVALKLKYLSQYFGDEYTIIDEYDNPYPELIDHYVKHGVSCFTLSYDNRSSKSLVLYPTL